MPGAPDRVRSVILPGGQVENLVGAQRGAPGVVLIGLVVAEVVTDLGEAFAAIARFRLLLGFSGPVENGLRDAVEDTGP